MKKHFNDTYINKLSKRELEAMEKLVLLGGTKQAARSMNISPRTLEIYVTNIKEKLNINYKYQFNKIILDNFYTRRKILHFSEK